MGNARIDSKSSSVVIPPVPATILNDDVVPSHSYEDGMLVVCGMSGMSGMSGIRLIGTPAFDEMPRDIMLTRPGFRQAPRKPG